MFIVGQKVMVRRTGSYGIVTFVRGDTITVLVEDRNTFTFDRCQLDIVDPKDRWS